jgi:hypothetical protein
LQRVAVAVARRRWRFVASLAGGGGAIGGAEDNGSWEGDRNVAVGGRMVLVLFLFIFLLCFIFHAKSDLFEDYNTFLYQNFISVQSSG